MTRYLKVDGNIKVRRDGRILTDIDGAVFDRVSGELAIFQIKWQDFFTNDVRELRSKARNFVETMDAWGGAVEAWLNCVDKIELQQTLRLKLTGAEAITNVYLFGISRSGARFQGYGMNIKNERLALANWPQFVRLRLEIGSVEQVFSQLHHQLRLEAQARLGTEAIPFTIEVAGRKIHFENFWHAI